MHLRLIVLVAACTTIVSPAAAQEPARFDIGPVVRTTRVSIEAGATGGITVTGVAATVRFKRALGVEGELTASSGGIVRSYQGTFSSYPPPGLPSTNDTFERYAPIARRTLGYDPGLGWTVAFVARGNAGARVDVTGRVGASATRYVETSDYDVLSIPENVDPALVARDFQHSSRRKTRGGLLVGMDVAISITPRFRIGPEVRFVYGGPAQVGNKHRELALGVRMAWSL